MKSKIYMAGIVLFFAMSALAVAADISGKWTAQASGVELTLVFKVNGNVLTGTVNNPQAGDTDIKDGKIDGDAISFYLLRRINDADMKIIWKGKAAVDEIKFTRTIEGAAGGPPTEVTAKRAK